MALNQIFIKNGLIVDGTGTPAYVADLRVAGDKIAEIGRLQPSEAERVIDAAGKAVCPGFIDVHSHSELSMLAGDHTAGVCMGVTTEFTGPDGFGFAPLPPDRLEEYRAYLYGIYADTSPDCGGHSFPEYLENFKGQVYNNIAAQVPHGAIRLAVKGWASGPAREDELQEMRSLTRGCMEAGAVGIAAGLDYVPASQADLRELIELSKVVAEYGGIYAAHIRGYDDQCRAAAVAETVAICEQARLPVHINHFFGNPAIYNELDAAIDRGIDITIDTYPYTAGCTLLAFVLPRTLIQVSPARFIEQLLQPAMRAVVRRAVEQKLPEDNPAYFAFLKSPENKWMEGQRVRDVARQAGKPFADFVCDLLIEEQLAPLLVYPWVGGPEENEDRLRCSLTHPAQMVITDGIYTGSASHPRGWGTFPRILGEYVREKNWLTLEDAVRRMTSFPAERFGIADRGCLRPGLASDLVIFDPQTVRDMATFDQPQRPPLGIEQVFVNGSQVVENSVLVSGNRPGRLLSRQRLSRQNGN